MPPESEPCGPPIGIMHTTYTVMCVLLGNMLSISGEVCLHAWHLARSIMWDKVVVEVRWCVKKLSVEDQWCAPHQSCCWLVSSQWSSWMLGQNLCWLGSWAYLDGWLNHWMSCIIRALWNNTHSAVDNCAKLPTVCMVTHPCCHCAYFIQAFCFQIQCKHGVKPHFELEGCS